MDLIELHADPQKMAEFMGWLCRDEESIQEEIDELEERIGQLKDMLYSSPNTGYSHKPLTAQESIERRFRGYRESIRTTTEGQLHSNFVRECARESLGIKGRTVEDVRRQCIEKYPQMFKGPKDDSEWNEWSVTPAPVGTVEYSALAPQRLD